MYAYICKCKRACWLYHSVCYFQWPDVGTSHGTNDSLLHDSFDLYDTEWTKRDERDIKVRWKRYQREMKARRWVSVSCNTHPHLATLTRIVCVKSIIFSKTLQHTATHCNTLQHTATQRLVAIWVVWLICANESHMFRTCAMNEVIHSYARRRVLSPLPMSHRLIRIALRYSLRSSQFAIQYSLLCSVAKMCSYVLLICVVMCYLYVNTSIQCVYE